jgi:hypothetical protein
VQAYETAAPVTLPPLGVACEEARLPAKTYSSADEARAAVTSLEAELARARDDRNPGRVTWAELRLNRARACLESLRTGKPLPPVMAPIWGLALGEVGVASGPGEIFCEIGLAVKQAAVFPHTIYVSNTNGSIGYVPVPEAYPEGGYEVESASRVGPGAAAVVAESSIALLKRARRLARQSAA